jgi:hypothetical protein
MPHDIAVDIVISAGAGWMDDRVVKLLLKAVRTLPEREQDQVLAELIRSSPFAGAGPAAAPHGPPDVVMLSDPGPIGMPGTPEAARTAMFPVRLPPDLHERLRRWSSDHGFSMASVVRGLVERFLDEQAQARPRRPGAARARRKGPTARG